VKHFLGIPRATSSGTPRHQKRGRGPREDGDPANNRAAEIRQSAGEAKSDANRMVESDDDNAKEQIENRYGHSVGAWGEQVARGTRIITCKSGETGSYFDKDGLRKAGS